MRHLLDEEAPLGLNTGSVRAIIALGIVGAAIAQGLIDKEIFLLAAGWYLGKGHTNGS